MLRIARKPGICSLEIPRSEIEVILLLDINIQISSDTTVIVLLAECYIITSLISISRLSSIAKQNKKRRLTKLSEPHCN